MRNTNAILRIVGVIAGLALIARTTDAHHTASHDQNPSPPADLGPTTILHYEAGSLILPMDICYARTSYASDSEQAVVVWPSNIFSSSCLSNSQKDDGLIPTYSLVFRLILDGIPVSWAIRSGKTGWNDYDFSVVKASGGPVTWRLPGGSENTTQYDDLTSIKYRGAPFVIDAAYAAQALARMDSYAAANSRYEDVDVHIAQVSFDAPIYRTLTELPKLALLDISDPATDLHNQKTSFAGDIVTDSQMADLEGVVWEWVTIPEVMGGGLDGFDLAWCPSFDLDSPGMPTAAQTAFIDRLAEFADDGGSILFQDGAIGALEGYGTMNGSGTVYTAAKPATTNFMIDGGMVANGISSGWDNGSLSETTLSTDYSDPASQFGGSHWTGIGGSKYNWKPRYDKAYLPGVRRMIYSYDWFSDSKRRWDFATWRKKDNDSDKGTIFYLGGDNWRDNTAAGFRIVMNTMLATTPVQDTEATEIARSSPIIAVVDGVEVEFTGTLEAQLPPQTAPAFASAADAANFEFPWVVGHFRGLDVAQLADGETEFDSAGGAILFDAATKIPSISYGGSGCSWPATGTCRRVFTDTYSGDVDDPDVTMVVQGNSALLQPLLGVADDADADTLIARIHAGRKNGASYEAKLGGVDRSTVAVIEPSPLISNGRSTMAYFGATDGMLHAVCAEDGPGCPEAGVEMWAFLPSTEIGKVKTNSTRIDGSPKVADVFGRFGTAREMRTVLVFQTGNQNESATYALDITDPQNPDVLWKLVTEGPGIGIAMGWVVDNSAITPMTFIQSANDPEGATSGFHVRAIDTVTGEERWHKPYDYPAPRDPTHDPVPLTAMPGGVTVLPSEGGRTVDSILVPSLYGQVFRLDPLTGENLLGTSALFDFAEDFHPIGASVSLYRGQDDGILRALVVSGGFADPFAPSATEWAPDDVHQYAVGFPVLTEDVPVLREQIEDDPSLGVHIDFGAGQRAFSPAVVAGDEVFITTDSTAVNSSDYGAVADTGKLWRKDLSDPSAPATSVDIPSGAAAVDVSISTGTVLSGGFSSVQVTRPSGFDAIGTTTEVAPTSSSSRRLWLRLR